MSFRELYSYATAQARILELDQRLGQFEQNVEPRVAELETKVQAQEKYQTNCFTLCLLGSFFGSIVFFGIGYKIFK